MYSNRFGTCRRKKTSATVGLRMFFVSRTLCVGRGDVGGEVLSVHGDDFLIFFLTFPGMHNLRIFENIVQSF